mmetsp:Transcript_61620/g.102526  ORF Transcript_61620/g.102526 Transcript_61620/m.102526 type:complete len:248 (-) Transcript_61620:163-906(-)
MLAATSALLPQSDDDDDDGHEDGNTNDDHDDPPCFTAYSPDFSRDIEYSAAGIRSQATAEAAVSQSTVPDVATPSTYSGCNTTCAITEDSQLLSNGQRSAALPSAIDVLDTGSKKPSFLHIQGPDFDASTGFQPPPTTAADLGPVVGHGNQACFASVPPPRGWQGEHAFTCASEDQRYASEYNFGRLPGAIRLRGSVCYESDDERGRRVRYGAHAMLTANPWSACNPNFAMSDASVTRGKDRGKRKR